MKNCMITFRSVTPAQRGEGVLKRGSIPCVLQRTPRWMQEKGCGYSLRLECRQLQETVSLLRKNGIAFQKAYTLLDGGAVEEWNL